MDYCKMSNMLVWPNKTWPGLVKPRSPRLSTKKFLANTERCNSCQMNPTFLGPLSGEERPRGRTLPPQPPEVLSISGLGKRSF